MISCGICLSQVPGLWKSGRAEIRLLTFYSLQSGLLCEQPQNGERERQGENMLHVTKPEVWIDQEVIEILGENPDSDHINFPALRWKLLLLTKVKFSFYISGFCALLWLRKSEITHLYQHLPLLEPGPHHSRYSQCLIHNFGPRGPRMTVPWLASCLLHLPVPVQVLWPWGVLSVQWGQMCWGVTSLGAILKQRRKGVGV